MALLTFLDYIMQFEEYFYYDETSPSCLIWKNDVWSGEDYRALRIRAGTPAGSRSKKGYYRVIINQKSYVVHRIIWEIHYGKIPKGLQVDHKNQIKYDNRIVNLRLVDNPLNKRNSGKYKNNTSGVTGVRKIVMSGIEYWSATWADKTYKRVSAYYSIPKYGEEEAFRLACEKRALEINNRNLEGAGYTKMHGL